MVGAHSLEEMVGKLKRPRRVMILVKAGAAVDAFIDKLVPLLEKVNTNRHTCSQECKKWRTCKTSWC